MKQTHSLVQVAVIAVIAGIPLDTSVAQQVAGTEGAALEEIVVTARKREESLQNVPISISVVSGEVLREGNISKLENLAATIPNFHHSESVTGNDQLFIRGVGSGVNFGFENSVGQVFDGFFFGRGRFGRALFMDLERVEILKGPQGALIGKNTTAGAINITSAKPTSEFQAYVQPTWEFEGDDGVTVEGAVSGPWSDRVRGRLAFRYEDRDGYYVNLVRDEEEIQREEWSARGTLEVDLAENVQATLLYQYSDSQREGRNSEAAACSDAFRLFLVSIGDDCEFNQTNARILLENGVEKKATTNTETHLAGVTIDWDTPVGTVSSLSGYSRYEVRDHFDSDGTSVESVGILARETYDQWSEELRLTSTGDNVVDYIVGGYFLSVDHGPRIGIDFNFMGPAPLPVLPPFARARNNRETHQKSETWAGFGQLTWHLNPQWDLIAGVRYTYEDKDARQLEFPTTLYTDTRIPPPPVGPARNVHDVTGHRTENQWTPNGGIQWRPTDQAMLYASVSRGFKGGGFDAQISGNQAFAEAGFEYKDESVTAYEVGGKFTFPDARFQVNVAAFRSEFDDIQVSTLVPGLGALVFQVGNAASATSQGVEADFRWRPAERLQINGAVAYLNAEFDKYDDAPCFALQTAAQGCVGGLQDLSGKELQFSPDWKASIDGQYSWPLPGDLVLRLSSRVTYNDRTALALDLDPKSFQDDFTKVDASLILGRQDGRWQVALVGQNLTDKLTANFANDGPGPDGASFSYFTAPPRSIALQVKISTL